MGGGGPGPGGQIYPGDNFAPPQMDAFSTPLQAMGSPNGYNNGRGPPNM